MFQSPGFGSVLLFLGAFIGGGILLIEFVNSPSSKPMEFEVNGPADKGVCDMHDSMVITLINAVQNVAAKLRSEVMEPLDELNKSDFRSLEIEAIQVSTYRLIQTLDLIAPVATIRLVKETNSSTPSLPEKEN